MRFTDIVYDVIVEEIKNKSTIQFLYKKWLGDNATETQREAVDNLIGFFGKKRDALSLKQPAVKSFLEKFGPESGEYFEPKNLKDVTKYTLNQMKALQKEFIDDDLNNNEAIKNIINNWYNNQPNEEQLHKGYKMLTWFNNIRPNLSPDLPEVVSFLHRFDGETAPLFNPANLKEISTYTLENIEGLYYEFHDYSQEMGVNDNPAFAEGGTKSNEQKRSASEELWKGNDNIVVNEGTLKVHFVPDQKTAIKYGYYAQEMRNLIGNISWDDTSNSKMHWCVTGRGGSDSWSNLWGSYRRNRTFYFVIDESKNPKTNEGLPKETSKYYLGALQRYSRDNWGLTSVLNDGGDSPSDPYRWSDILKVYPQLANHEDELPLVQFDEAAELNVDNRLVNRINENGGSSDFSKQTPTIKKAYINEGHPIKKARSWQTLNTYLRNLYIAKTEEGNMFNSWQTSEIIEAVKETPQFYSLLVNKIEAICSRSNNPEIKNKGISVLISKIVERDYTIVRTSIDNPNYRLVNDKQKSEDIVGIYNLESMWWLNLDGIEYKDNYTLAEIQLYKAKDTGENYIVMVYTKTGNIDPTSFFVLHPVSLENQLGEAHFITYKKFQELLKKLIPKEEDDNDDMDTSIIQGFSPDTDVDIKEADFV